MAARTSGILLPAASLPGDDGIGDLGEGARLWLDWLVEAGQGIWQLLPLGPAGASGSPYDGPSSFAGEPLLISLEALAADGLLDRDALADGRRPPGDGTDLAAARRWKTDRLRQAWAELRRRGPGDPLARELEEWGRSEAGWLEGWALWAGLRESRAGGAWTGWPPPLRDRRPAALAAAARELEAETGYHRFVQYLFCRQWAALHRQAARRGITLLGDLPIYCALDSAEVWARRDLFNLDRVGLPRHVAGVPPDAFSADGQLWGHPLYRWRRHGADGYTWWVGRLRLASRRTDLVRIDHFRGFAGYWEVPAGAATAAAGRWRRGPGRAPFDAARAALGHLPLIAEDLGDIDEEVHALRRDLGLPGTRVLQFGLEEGADSLHLPHRFEPELVAYTGTHDNDTCRGWFARLEPARRRRVLDAVGGGPEEIHWSMITVLHDSVADRVVVPMQDLLGLGSEARLNVPGRAGGNWSWRLDRRHLTTALADRLGRLTAASDRRAARPARSGPRQETSER